MDRISPQSSCGNLDAAEVIKLLDLKPLPIEGGFFRETYRSDEAIPQSALPPRYGRDKQFCTDIFYMLQPGSVSRLHRVASDEIFHFHMGDAVTMLQLHSDGSGNVVVLGGDIRAGQALKCVVPRGSWQGAILNDGGRFALMSCTVAPAFDYSDFEAGDAAKLAARYPQWADLIRKIG